VSRVAAFPFVAALLLPGCPDPNLYTTPRTLDPDTVQFQVAPELIVVDNPPAVSLGPGNTTNPGTTSLPIATFGARIGVLDGFELGMREQFNFGALAMDAKVRLLKGRLDVALDPGFQAMYGADGSPTYFQAPVLLGVNVWDWLSVVLSPGFAYATAASWPSSETSGPTPVFAPTEEGSGGGTLQASPMGALNAASGAMARIGIGLQLRATRKFAIHPEVTFLKPVRQTVLVAIVGIGFDFGAQPDYSDLAGTPSAPLTPAGSSPSAAPPSAPPSPADPGY
jgi:hypothetical protein